MREINSITHPTIWIRGQATVRFHTKGTVVFSRRAIAKIGLKHEDKIVFMIDENGVYVTKTNGAEGFKIRSHTSGAAMFNSIAVVAEILKGERPGKTYDIGNPFEFNGRVLFPLLTK